MSTQLMQIQPHRFQPPPCIPHTAFPCVTTPTAPENGHVACSFGNYFGSKCVFSCEDGYALENGDSDDGDDFDEEVQTSWSCMKNGRFGDEIAPRCKRE